MKNSFFTSKSSIIRAIIALIIGILAIALPSITLEYLIITIGLLLLFRLCFVYYNGYKDTN